MSMRSKINGLDVYTITSKDGRSRASFVPERGGAGSSLILPFGNDERELLFLHKHFWDKESKHLPGGWPFIFPICARIERGGIAGNYLYDGKLYNLPIHGFAPYMQWEVTESAPTSLILSLRDTPETFANYPFHFLVELQYQISDRMLICRQRYTNSGDKPMPYYAGFHPYFATPPAHAGKEQVFLDYQPVRHLRYNEKLTDIVGEDELFKLPISVNDSAVNEQLVELGENKLINLTYPDGLKINLEVVGAEDADMFRFVQVYTQPEEPFICVEPWMAFPNALNTVSGVRWLQPGKSEQGILKLWV